VFSPPSLIKKKLCFFQIVQDRIQHALAVPASHTCLDLGNEAEERVRPLPLFLQFCSSVFPLRKILIGTEQPIVSAGITFGDSLIYIAKIYHSQLFFYYRLLVHYNALQKKVRATGGYF